MNNAPDSQTVEVLAALLDLPVPDESKENVAEHLRIARRMAGLVLEFSLEDTQEPAPVFCP